MKATFWSLVLAATLLLAGCASGPYRPYRPAPDPYYHPDYYHGPGSVPPSWYDYDPAYRHWYDPWYVNPYKQ